MKKILARATAIACAWLLSSTLAFAQNVTPPPGVSGPASATNGHIAIFNGTSGQAIADGGAVTSGTVTSVICGTGLTGGTITNTGTCGVDFGTTANKAVQGAGALGTPSSGNGTNITNVNAATLGGATFAAPSPIGNGTPNTVVATTLGVGTAAPPNGIVEFKAATPLIRMTGTTANSAWGLNWHQDANFGAEMTFNYTTGHLVINSGEGIYSGDIDLYSGAVYVADIKSTGILLKVASGDTATTDATICRRSSDGLLLIGTGALGVCLGTSSQRFKHGIEPLALGIEQIMQLQPKSYYLNKDHGDPTQLQYGLIAEDVLKTLPVLVRFDKDGKVNNYDWSGLFPVLINGEKDLQKQIWALKAENARLRAVNNTEAATIRTIGYRLDKLEHPQMRQAKTSLNRS